MKIVKLTKDRVRVFLTVGDLLDMKIDSGTLAPDSPQLGMFLCEILEAVKAETGFSLSDGQVIAEATPKEDGIVLELSHLEKHEQKPVKKDSVVFEIASFEALTSMLKNIQTTHLLNMRLYFCQGNYYVAVPKKRVPAIIYEYSFKRGKSNVAESKVAEYGRLVAGGYRLMCMASALKKIN